MRNLLIAGALLCLPATAALAAPASAAAADDADEAASKAVVEALYKAFATGDAATISALLSPALVWVEAEGGPYADRNPYVGPMAVFEGVFGRIGQAFKGFAATPASFHASGDKVYVEGRYTGTSNATGKALNAQFVHVLTVKGGQVTAFQQYTDTAQWNAVMAN